MGSIIRDKRSGSVVLAIRYKDVDGRIRKERTKAATVALARRILAERERAVEQARLQELESVDRLIKPKAAVTIRQFMDEYFSHLDAQCKASTVKRYRNFVKNHILPGLGALTLRRAGAGDVQRYADRRMAESAPATVRQEMMFLSGLFREAMKRGLVDKNPVTLTDKPEVDNRIIRFLDTAEEAELLRVAPEPLRSQIIVAIDSGLRATEQRLLEWTDVRFDRNVIVVRNTKGKKDREVPMSKTLAATLERLSKHEASPYVFTNSDTGTHYDRFNNTTWRSILRAAGIRKCRWHDLRHTFGSRLAQAGVALLVIKELMGHADITVTMRYAHLQPSNLHSAVKVLDGFHPAGDETSAHPSAHEPETAKPEAV